MHDIDRQAGDQHPGDAPPDLPDLAAAEAASATESEDFDETMIDEVSALIDDGRTYAEAEIAYQKSRAKLAGRSIAVATGALVLGVVLLHIAFLALAVGLVIALTPLVTVWGAIAIVVGGLLVMVAVLFNMAMKRARKVNTLFSSNKGDDA